jgi:uncharacterized protein CbrC (UPF0167 family)
MSLMDDSLKNFNAEIDKFVAGIPDKVMTIQKKIALEALRMIVERTPVRTGRAKGNWQVTIGQPAIEALNAFDIEGMETVRQGLAALSDLPPYQVVYITNNVNYISFLEEGTSEQAPKGMVSVTVDDLREMFKEIQ